MYSEKINLENGSIIYAAYSALTVEQGQIGSTAVAVAIPFNTDESGVIFECSSLNEQNDLETVLRQMCEEAMGNRNKSIANIKSISNIVTGEQDHFLSAISAVVLW